MTAPHLLLCRYWKFHHEILRHPRIYVHPPFLLNPQLTSLLVITPFHFHSLLIQSSSVICSALLYPLYLSASLHLLPLATSPPLQLATSPPLHLSTSPPLHFATSPPRHLSTSQLLYPFPSYKRIMKYRKVITQVQILSSTREPWIFNLNITTIRRKDN